MTLTVGGKRYEKNRTYSAPIKGKRNTLNSRQEGSAYGKKPYIKGRPATGEGTTEAPYTQAPPEPIRASPAFYQAYVRAQPQFAKIAEQEAREQGAGGSSVPYTSAYGSGQDYTKYEITGGGSSQENPQVLAARDEARKKPVIRTRLQQTAKTASNELGRYAFQQYTTAQEAKQNNQPIRQATATFKGDVAIIARQPLRGYARGDKTIGRDIVISYAGGKAIGLGLGAGQTYFAKQSLARYGTTAAQRSIKASQYAITGTGVTLGGIYLATNTPEQIGRDLPASTALGIGLGTGLRQTSPKPPRTTTQYADASKTYTFTSGRNINLQAGTATTEFLGTKTTRPAARITQTRETSTPGTGAIEETGLIRGRQYETISGQKGIYAQAPINTIFTRTQGVNILRTPEKTLLTKTQDLTLTNVETQGQNAFFKTQSTAINTRNQIGQNQFTTNYLETKGRITKTSTFPRPEENFFDFQKFIRQESIKQTPGIKGLRTSRRASLAASRGVVNNDFIGRVGAYSETPSSSLIKTIETGRVGRAARISGETFIQGRGTTRTRAFYTRNNLFSSNNTSFGVAQPSNYAFKNTLLSTQTRGISLLQTGSTSNVGTITNPLSSIGGAIVGYGARPRTGLMDSIRGTPDSTPFTEPPPPPPPPETPFFPVPGGFPLFGIGGRGKNTQKSRGRTFSYAPSLGAGLLGITSQKAPQTFTGLETRPIITAPPKRKKRRTTKK